MSKINLLIAGDHIIVREGIRALLEKKYNYNILELAIDKAEIFELCSSAKIDLIILLIKISNVDTIQVTDNIKNHHPQIKILGLADEAQTDFMRRMVRAGAAGYLLKYCGKEELYQAVDSLLQGRYFFSDQVRLSVIQNSEKGSNPDEITSLTNREIDVLKLICKEYTNQEIAKKLYLSVRTIDAHRRNLLQKTGARNTAGLVRFAFENHLID